MRSRMLRSAGKFGHNRLNAAGYILVGGASSRFGSDKAFAEIGGKTMAGRMVDVLRGVMVHGVWLIGNAVKYRDLGAECIPDLWPGEGPLGGILTALRHTASLPRFETSDYNLIISCDLPFLNLKWLEELLFRAFESDAQVVVPQSAVGLEPLCAVWRTDALSAVQREFARGLRKVTQAMKQLPMEVLDESLWKRFDSDNRLFSNMNTPADYEEARRVLEDKERRAEPWTPKFDQGAKKFTKRD